MELFIIIEGNYVDVVCLLMIVYSVLFDGKVMLFVVECIFQEGMSFECVWLLWIVELDIYCQDCVYVDIIFSGMFEKIGLIICVMLNR